jgi:hypothetical protein
MFTASFKLSTKYLRSCVATETGGPCVACNFKLGEDSFYARIEYWKPTTCVLASDGKTDKHTLFVTQSGRKYAKLAVFKHNSHSHELSLIFRN